MAEKDGRSISTGGGAYTEGNVQTGGGDFVGHDKNVMTGLSAGDVESLFKSIYSTFAGL